MDAIFNWSPIVWLLRIALASVLTGAIWIGALYFVRFVRPANVRALLRGNLPDVGSVELLGQKIELHHTAKESLVGQVKALEVRLSEVEQKYVRLVERAKNTPLGPGEGQQ